MLTSYRQNSADILGVHNHVYNYSGHLSCVAQCFHPPINPKAFHSKLKSRLFKNSRHNPSDPSAFQIVSSSKKPHLSLLSLVSMATGLWSPLDIDQWTALWYDATLVNKLMLCAEVYGCILFCYHSPVCKIPHWFAFHVRNEGRGVSAWGDFAYECAQRGRGEVPIMQCVHIGLFITLY